MKDDTDARSTFAIHKDIFSFCFLKNAVVFLVIVDFYYLCMI